MAFCLTFLYPYAYEALRQIAGVAHAVYTYPLSTPYSVLAAVNQAELLKFRILGGSNAIRRFLLTELDFPT